MPTFTATLVGSCLLLLFERIAELHNCAVRREQRAAIDAQNSDREHERATTLVATAQPATEGGRAGGIRARNHGNEATQKRVQQGK